jgi:hypothetical protein
MSLLALAVTAAPASAATPTVTIAPAAEVGVTNAKFSGEVDPGGEATNYHFEYITDSAFDAETDAKQSVYLFTEEGSFTLAFEGQTTGDIAFDASAATVESALNGLSTIGGAGGSVTVTGGPGDPSGGTPYLVSFGGALAKTNVETLGVTGSSFFGYAETTLAGHSPGFGGASFAGEGELEASAAATPVEATPELSPGTEYHLRLVATNASGTAVDVAPNFTTTAVTVPVLTLDPPTNVKFTSAHISGTIDPEGGNVNPIGGPLPISWELQASRDPVNLGWEFAQPGTIEGVEAKSSSPKAVEADFTGLQNGTEYKFRLRATYANGLEATTGEGSFETEPVTAPTVTLDPVTTFTGTTAHFSGHVTAGGTDPAFDTSCAFKFVTDKQFAVDAFASARSIACNPNPVTGTGSTAVSADPIGLLPGNTYHVLLVASNLNAGGPVTAGPQSFDAPVIVPSARTGSAHVSSGAASITGEINPNGAEVTSYFFEYGTSTAYGQKTSSKAIAVGNSPVAVGAVLPGLSPATEYHYRLVATNSAGTGEGIDKSFTTAKAVADPCPNAVLRAENNSSALPDCRAYELVNPPGLDLGEIARVPIVSDDGTHVAYASQVAPNGASSAQNAYLALARRTPSGWLSVDANAALPQGQPTQIYAAPIAFSADYSKLAISTSSSLNADDLDHGGADIYLLDLGTGVTSWLSVGEPLPDVRFAGTANYLGSSPDLERVVFLMANDSLISGAPLNFGIYVRDANGLSLVSLLPSGVAPNEVQPVGRSGAHGGSHGVSDDATRVFFDDVTGGTGAVNSIQGLYERDGNVTIPVSASERAGDGGDPNHVWQFVGATHDGGVAYFNSAEQLTDAATPGGGIYRFQLGAPAGHRLEQITPANGNPPGLQTGGSFEHSDAILSDDGSHIYFTSPTLLTPDAVSGATNAYVWSGGSTKLIAAFPTNVRVERVSRDGRFALLTSGASANAPAIPSDSIDGAPTNGHAALYEYDDATGDVACVSCRPDGSPSQGDAQLGTPPPAAVSASQPTRNISDDGRVFFDSTDRIVGADQTDAQDVYEYDRGTVSLLSSGQGNDPFYLADNSDDGRNVFILARSPLLPQDKDARELDVYDVHIEGGFPQPSAAPAPCEGEACRGQTSTRPADANPVTPSFSGPGNPKPCKKGFVKKQNRCVKKKHRKKRAGQKKGGHKRDANSNGRTGR